MDDQEIPTTILVSFTCMHSLDLTPMTRYMHSGTLPLALLLASPRHARRPPRALLAVGWGAARWVGLSSTGHVLLTLAPSA